MMSKNKSRSELIAETKQRLDEAARLDEAQNWTTRQAFDHFKKKMSGWFFWGGMHALVVTSYQAPTFSEGREPESGDPMIVAEFQPRHKWSRAAKDGWQVKHIWMLHAGAKKGRAMGGVAPYFIMGASGGGGRDDSLSYSGDVAAMVNAFVNGPGYSYMIRKYRLQGLPDSHVSSDTYDDTFEGYQPDPSNPRVAKFVPNSNEIYIKYPFRTSKHLDGLNDLVEKTFGISGDHDVAWYLELYHFDHAVPHFPSGKSTNNVFYVPDPNMSAVSSIQDSSTKHTGIGRIRSKRTRDGQTVIVSSNKDVWGTSRDAVLSALVADPSLGKLPTGRRS